jgi:nicotinamide riboside transporter PnuC
MSPWWSVALTVVGVTGLFFTLRKKWWGQAIALSGQVLWLAYSIKTQQWGFLGSVFAYGGLNLWGLLKWRKEANEPREHE